MPTSTNEESWYALRTFFSQELKVSQYLEANALKHFIPMRSQVHETRDGHLVRRMYPVVHNLIFVRKTMSRAAMHTIFSQCPYPISVYHHIDSEQRWCEISDKELMDLRLICDVTFTEPKFISQEESELEVGTEVVVMHGPLKGIQGKLVRKQKKYYILKTFVGMGVSLAISRWCCKPLDESLTINKKQ